MTRKEILEMIIKLWGLTQWTTKELLKVAELNQDSLESDTIKTISKARDIINLSDLLLKYLDNTK